MLPYDAGMHPRQRQLNAIRLLCCCALLAVQAVQPAAQTPAMKQIMLSKLNGTQQLLEHIVRADFAGISRSADQLSRISETEIASWQTVNQPEYFQQATRFLLSVKGLREAAAKRDVSAASQEYMTLVSSCVECHTFVRGTRNASLQPAR